MSFAEVVERSQVDGDRRRRSMRAKDFGQEMPQEMEKFAAPGWPFGAQAVEVEVDRETGVVKLMRVASAHDVGKAINPMALTSQIQGGIMMGLGYALWEGLLFEEGRIVNASFADYKIPTVRDIPTAIPIIVEKNYARNPTALKAWEKWRYSDRPGHRQCDRPRGRRAHQRFADVGGEVTGTDQENRKGRINTRPSLP